MTDATQIEKRFRDQLDKDTAHAMTNHVFPRPCRNPGNGDVLIAAAILLDPHRRTQGAIHSAFATLTHAFHGDAAAAGWHHNIETGEPKRRNIGEMTMLAISELAEAMEGHRKRRMDDKLPHRPMLDVEIADFVIRGFDTIAIPAFEGIRLDLNDAMTSAARFPKSDNIADGLRHIVAGIANVSDALVHVDAEHAKFCIARGLFMAFRFAASHGLDLGGALVDKRDYNARREDHSVSARLAAGGKAF